MGLHRAETPIDISEEKIDDVWGCTEWEPKLIFQKIRANTGRVERLERVIEPKSRARLPA